MTGGLQSPPRRVRQQVNDMIPRVYHASDTVGSHYPLTRVQMKVLSLLVWCWKEARFGRRRGGHCAVASSRCAPSSNLKRDVFKQKTSLVICLFRWRYWMESTWAMIRLLALEVVYQNRVLDQHRMLSLRFKAVEKRNWCWFIETEWQRRIRRKNQHNHQLSCRHDIRIQTQLRWFDSLHYKSGPNFIRGAFSLSLLLSLPFTFSSL